jgi:hypothetical protein
MKLCATRFTAAVLLTAALVIAARGATEQIGAWSATVDGLRGRLITKEDKPFEGTRMIAAYIELENVSDIGDPMEFYFEPTKTVISKVVDDDGKPPPPVPTAADIITGPPFWLAIPTDGSMRFRVSISGYGVYKNSGTNVQMMSGNWVIKPDDKRKYYLEARFVSKPPAMDKRRAWSGELTMPRVLIPD